MMKLLKWKCGLSAPLILSLFFFPFSRGSAQTRPVEGLHENTPNVIALTRATICIAPLRTISDATLVIRDGQIEAVGQDVPIPPDAVVTDLSGKYLYAGFIDLYTHYGIPEIKPDDGKKEAEKGAGHWNDAIHPEMDAASLFSPDAKSAQEFRASGITCALILPRDGILRGAGALTLLADGDRNSSLIRSGHIQSMAFERNRRSAGYPNSLMGAIALIRQTFLDAAWYGEAWRSFHASPAGQTPPETNLALAAISAAAVYGNPYIMETTNELDILHSAKLAREFNLKLWVRGSGYEYRRLDRIRQENLNIILPVNFPQAPDVSTKGRELEVSLRDLRHWDIAPANPARLHRAGISFALTTSTLPELKNFLPNVRKAIERGLPEDEALAALTTIPAGWLGMSDILGTLEKGKIANIIVADGKIFEDKVKIADVYIAGKKYIVTKKSDAEIRGTWDMQFTMGSESGSATVVIEGETEALKGTIAHGGTKVKISSVTLEGRRLTLLFSADSFGFAGTCRMEGTIEEKRITGTGSWIDGSEFTWQAQLQPDASEKKENKKEQPGPEETVIVYPGGAFGRSAPPEQPEHILLRNGTLWTSGEEGIIAGGDMLIERGKIVLVGRNLEAPEGALVIDATGRHVTPGIIDAHSHLAIDRGVNEATDANTAETRVEDVIEPDDVNIYRQLAGGVTMAELIHGSANPIGGQTATVKLRWGSLPDEMIFEHAMPGIKFALGENVKQSNWGMELSRYPKTRMGVEQYMRDSFQAAKDYRAEWQNYERKKYASPNLVPPRRILRNEALLEVLDGKRQVHCHAYRQDEILATLRLAEEIGFRIDVLIHILEGYKVAEAIKAHGAMPTTFSDWWAYKFEVIDAIPYNGPLMREEGLVVSFNSDDYELARRLNTEAAKAVKYGGVPPEDALKFVTINPAKQLRIDRYAGSLEQGKDADFVIWSGDPLSPFSICEETWIDGRNYFSISVDKELRLKAEREKARLVQKILQNLTKNAGK